MEAGDVHFEAGGWQGTRGGVPHRQHPASNSFCQSLLVAFAASFGDIAVRGCQSQRKVPMPIEQDA